MNKKVNRQKGNEMKPANPCDHILCVKDDHKACITCGATLGCAYTAERMVEDVKLILSEVLTRHAEAKAKFMVEADKDLSNAVRWHACDALVLHHRAAYVTQLRKAFEEAESMEDQREIVVREAKRLTTHLTRVSAAGWDSSTSPMANQDLKARTVADAESLKTLGEVLRRFDTYYADHALPRIR